MSSSFTICDNIFIGKIETGFLSDCLEILLERLSKSLKVKFIRLGDCVELLDSESDSHSFLLLLRETDTRIEMVKSVNMGTFNPSTGTFTGGGGYSGPLYISMLHGTVIDLKSKTIILDKIVRCTGTRKKDAVQALFDKMGGKIYDKIKYVPDSKNTRRR